MVKYNYVKEIFVKHNCELLMSEEEFNLEPRKSHDKYKYIAQCKHNHEVCFSDFKNKSRGLTCPECSYTRQSIEQKERSKINPLLRQDLEYDSIIYLRTIIGDSFDVKFNSENCISDCCIKPKHITEDLWLMVQLKSTEKPNPLGYHFDCNSKSKYINCIIMCICASDKKMWIFDGNIIIPKILSIGLLKSKNGEFEITKETIHDKITNYYNEFPKYDFETTDTPISESAKLEREYRIYRETMIHCLPFIRDERQALVYDFIVNGFRVQEKVRSQTKNKKGYNFALNKSCGIVNGVRDKTSYQKGDNDFYWLNVNNKQHFYIIPEHELLSRKYINIDKKASICLTLNSRIKKNRWANEYLFDYTNLTEIDIQRLKTMFNLY